MPNRFEDLAPLIAPARLPDSPTLGFRQGVVESWNPATAENTVRIGGTLFTNIPILNTAEALLLQPGDVVGIAVTGSGGASSFFIWGRITIPGTPDAAKTLGAGLKASFVSSSVAITSTASQLNGGPTVTTQILPSGKAFVLYASGMNLDIGEAVALGVVGTGPGGATTGTQGGIDGDNRLTTSSGTLWGTLTLSLANGELLDGMTPGQWTFELRSQRVAGVDPLVYSRLLTVLPL